MEKCKFNKKQVELIISKGHIKMNPIKVQGVQDWPIPCNVKDVQSFLGFENFYCHFICDFADIAKPLNALTHKTQKWAWGCFEQEAFEVLKRAVTSAPVFLFPSNSGHFHLECDASNFAMGAVLSQLQDDGQYHLIRFMSKSLT